MQTNPVVREFYQALSQGRPYEDLSAWEAFQRTHVSMAETNPLTTPQGAPQQQQQQQGMYGPVPGSGSGATPGSGYVKAEGPGGEDQPDSQKSQPSQPSQPSQSLSQCFK